MWYPFYSCDVTVRDSAILCYVIRVYSSITCLNGHLLSVTWTVFIDRIDVI